MWVLVTGQREVVVNIISVKSIGPGRHLEWSCRAGNGILYAVLECFEKFVISQIRSNSVRNGKT